MKIKQVLSLSLAIFIILPFTAIRAGAIKHTMLENQSHWAEMKEAPVISNNALNPGCVYYADIKDNCLYISLSIGQGNGTASAVYAQAIIKTSGWKQLIDISGEAYETHPNGIATQAKCNPGGDGYFNYNLALELSENTVYEITPVFLVNGGEVRLKSPIHFDSTVTTTEKETVTKAEKTSADKKASADKTEKETKTTTRKQSSKTTVKANQKILSPHTEDGLTEEWAAETQEMARLDANQNFFQAMSKPTRAVFIAAIILGALALVAVGMALGGRKGKTPEEPNEHPEEEKKE